jgi:hypothetical protein
MTDLRELPAVSEDAAGSDSPTQPIGNQDWFLARLVFFANQGSRFPITLSLRGVLISGMLVGGAEYFKKFGSDFRALGTTDEDKATLESWAANYAEIYEASPDGNSIASEPTYIHIMEGRYFAPGQRPIPSNAGLLWRGRLSEVDGFSLGTLIISDD